MPLYRDKEIKINLNPNQFLLSIGKHSGARAVTIDGLRKILVKLAQISNKRDEGNDPDKRIERLHKKSHFENEMIKNLYANFNLLDDKEKKVWKTGKNFLESPSELEWLVKQRERLTINAILTEETTIWKFGTNKNSNKLESFGWVLCEFIDEDDFTTTFKSYTQYGKQLIESRLKRKKEMLQAIKQIEDEAKEKALEKERAVEEEKREAKELKEERELQLATMSPIEKIIDSYDNNLVKVIQAMQSNSIENLEEIKIELAQKIKEELQKNPKEWERAKQKALKRKEYIEGILS